MELLKRQIQALGLQADGFDTDGRAEKFREYMELLLEWNQKINLTAIVVPEEIISKHFTDSLTVLTQTEIENGAALLDVGTGAGFPGVPLKIMRPDIGLTLLDSLNKRVKFLEELTARLGLDSVRTVHARAEDAAHDPKHRGKYDIVCARAVAKLSVLAEYCIPFVKNGGKFISMKAFEVKDEILESEKAILSMGGYIESVKQVNIPDTDICRTVIIVRKTGHTPTAYPRKASKIAKNPIK